MPSFPSIYSTDESEEFILLLVSLFDVFELEGWSQLTNAAQWRLSTHYKRYAEYVDLGWGGRLLKGAQRRWKLFT